MLSQKDGETIKSTLIFRLCLSVELTINCPLVLNIIILKVYTGSVSVCPKKKLKTSFIHLKICQSYISKFHLTKYWNTLTFFQASTSNFEWLILWFNEHCGRQCLLLFTGASISSQRSTDWQSVLYHLWWKSVQFQQHRLQVHPGRRLQTE